MLAKFTRPEPMLMVRDDVIIIDMGLKEGKNQAFKNLTNTREKTDGSMRWGSVGWFSGLPNRRYCCFLLTLRKITQLKAEVKDQCKECYAFWWKVFKATIVHPVRTGSFAVFQS